MQTYDTITELDYLKIQEDFERVTDYRAFILQYNHIKHDEVKFLIIQATWLIILNEQDPELKERDIIGFIRKYRDHLDQRVRECVIHALYLQLEKNTLDIYSRDYLEQSNYFIEYASSLKQLEEYAYKGLILAYWFKAKVIHRKDWRKAQYFYNKVAEFSQKISDRVYSLYVIKAQIAKVNLHLHYGHSEHIEKLFYVAMQKYAHHSHHEINILLDNTINAYLDYLMSEDRWFYQAEAGQIFIEFLSNHIAMQNIMLKSTIKENAIPRLVWVSYAYWGNQYYLLADQYLLRYFYFFEGWEEVVLSFKEYLQFNTAKDRKLFLEYAESLYKRHITLEKYRKMFRLDKTKN